MHSVIEYKGCWYFYNTMERNSTQQRCSKQVYPHTRDQPVTQRSEGVLNFNTPAVIATVADTLWQHLK